MLRFMTENWIEVYDQSGGSYNINKQIRFKTSMLQSDLCDYSDAYIIARGTMLQVQIIMHMIRNWLLKIMHHSLAAFKKLIIHSLIMQKI